MTDPIAEIPLDQIIADDLFNVRSGNWRADLDELEGSIEKDGQEVPGRVSPTKKTTPDGRQMFALISGFRRFESLKRLANRGVVRPFLASVSEMSQPEALEHNLRENVGRANLTPADTAFGVWRLHNATIAAGSYKSPEEISRAVCLPRQSVQHYLTIMRRCDAKVLAKWRSAPIPVSVYDMLSLARQPKDQQADEYKKILRGAKKAKREKTNPSLRRITAAAELMGKLHAAGLLVDYVDWRKHLGLFLETKPNARPATLDRLILAAQKAFEKGIDSENRKNQKTA